MPFQFRIVPDPPIIQSSLAESTLAALRPGGCVCAGAARCVASRADAGILAMNRALIMRIKIHDSLDRGLMVDMNSRPLLLDFDCWSTQTTGRTSVGLAAAVAESKLHKSL